MVGNISDLGLSDSGTAAAAVAFADMENSSKDLPVAVRAEIGKLDPGSLFFAPEGAAETTLSKALQVAQDLGVSTNVTFQVSDIDHDGTSQSLPTALSNTTPQLG